MKQFFSFCYDTVEFIMDEFLPNTQPTPQIQQKAQLEVRQQINELKLLIKKESMRIYDANIELSAFSVLQTIDSERLDHNAKFDQVKKMIESHKINVNKVFQKQVMKTNLLYHCLCFTNKYQKSPVTITMESDCIVLFKTLLTEGAKLGCNQIALLKRPIFSFILNTDIFQMRSFKFESISETTATSLRKCVRATIFDLLDEGLKYQATLPYSIKPSIDTQCINIVSPQNLEKDITLKQAKMLDEALSVTNTTRKMIPTFEILLLCNKEQNCILYRVPKRLLTQLIFGFIAENEVKECMSSMSK